MSARRARLAALPTLIALAVLSSVLVAGSCGYEARGHRLFEGPQADPLALSPDGTRLYVAHAPNDTVDVIDTASRTLLRSIQVGMEPVSVAVRPDGLELWVANHVSDSVSVIDTNPASPTYLAVIDTVESVDPTTLVTRFDEPVGIAFASNAKAYVALSSRNQVAVVDVATRSVTKFLAINAQEPRAIRVRGNRLYVLPFESGNQTELATCPSQIFPIDGDQCTFDQATLNFAQNPNLVGGQVDVVKDPDVPDRDLYVFDTASEASVSVVSGVGTLLYGLAVDGQGRVFIAMTDARNDVDGRAGTQGKGLADLENRLFLNQLGRVDCGGASCGAPSRIELEPLPPQNPAPGQQLATPFGIQVSGDDQLVVATAAGSNRVFTVDTASGLVLGRVDVGAIPRGVALRSDPGTGVAQTAYVLNAMDSSVSVVDLADPAAPVETARIAISKDPTPADILAGRIAFNDANASTTGTFSCGSCHPDGHVDQLLWVIGAQCTFSGCDQEEPRSTMPVRGLRDTLPLHWDGSLGDPIGGANGEIGLSGNAAPTCDNDQDCFRHLVNAAIGGVLCDQVACPTNLNELGLPGGLSEAERNAMATYLQNVAYPPPRSRRPDDTLSASALAGFEDFFMNQGGVNGPGAGGLGPETCADAPGGCHALPFGTGTNSIFVGGFDAPTMRGITDRYLLFSAGVTDVEEQLVFSPFISDVTWTPALGNDELANWALAFGSAANPGAFRNAYNTGPFDIFQMIEESGTGEPGLIGRQVTLNTRTANPPNRAASDALLALMERFNGESRLSLRGNGRRGGANVEVDFGNGSYDVGGTLLSRTQLLDEAAAGTLVVTLTSVLRSGITAATPQPGIAVPAVGAALTDGRPALPVLPAQNPMLLEGLHVNGASIVLVDGQRVTGTVACVGGTFSPQCTSNQLSVQLGAIPAPGTHVLQIQNGNGLVSNELPFTVQ